MAIPGNQVINQFYRAEAKRQGIKMIDIAAAIDTTNSRLGEILLEQRYNPRIRHDAARMLKFRSWDALREAAYKSV